jgi:putative addiction module component (TIGR02574 family)
MPKQISMADVLALSPSERLRLVEEIWDSIASVPESIDLTEEQRQELDSRLEAYRVDPQAGDPWDVVKARILKGR